jgi:hypothetical protein
MKGLLAVVIAAVAMAFPASAGSGYWHWGHNYVGNGVNTAVVSGFNYWHTSHVHKHSGDGVWGTYQHDNGNVCWEPVWMTGHWIDFWYGPGSVGCGGYLRNLLHWWFGNSSYLDIESWA